MSKNRPTLNKKIIIGLALNALIVMSMLLQDSDMNLKMIFVCIALIPWVVSLIGAYLISAGEKIKLGANLIFYGSIIFVPLGFITMLGARNVLDDLKQIEFEQTLVQNQAS